MQANPVPFGVVISKENAGTELEQRLVFGLSTLYEGGPDRCERLPSCWRL